MKLIYLLVAVAVLIIIYFTVLGVISRSGEAPGLVNERLSACGKKPNSVCSENDPDTEHYVAPIPASGAGLAQLAVVIESMGGRVTVLGQSYLAAQFSSSLFGFVDDLELRLEQEAGLIQVRSASRVGYSDFGANRKRVSRLRELLEAGHEST